MAAAGRNEARLGPQAVSKWEQASFQEAAYPGKPKSGISGRDRVRRSDAQGNFQLRGVVLQGRTQFPFCNHSIQGREPAVRTVELGSVGCTQLQRPTTQYVRDRDGWLRCSRRPPDYHSLPKDKV